MQNKQSVNCLTNESPKWYRVCIHTCFQGKCLRAAKPIVTAGLRWAPEMWPVDRITIITARPVEAASPINVSEPCVFWFTMAVAVPANISIRVPINSAPT